MTFFTRLAALPVFMMSAFAFAGTALAIGPEPNKIGFQPAVSPTMVEIDKFHNILVWLITAITIFVLVLMIYVMVRFREKANPVPSKTTHNVAVEIIWTVVPIVILVALAVPSLTLLYYTDRLPPEQAEMTIKAIGKQWYWSYEYPDNGNFTFDAYMLQKDELPADLADQFLLETDTEVVLPIETNIRVLVTGGDVIHNLAVPSLGIKLDGVPGRINETWTRIPASFEGEVLYGQCSELCGANHSYMPIKIRAVSKEDYAEWVRWAQEEYASVDSPDNRISVAGKAE